MTSIMLSVTGAQAWASVTGPLTSGMVGIPVTIEYDASWDGLIKNLVCRCSGWCSDSGDNRTILNVGETATVAHEVMKSDMYLYLGIEGYSPDGKLVIPTTWAACGKIQSGANTGADLSADPTLPIWNQLQTEIAQMNGHAITQEQVSTLRQIVNTIGVFSVPNGQDLLDAFNAAWGSGIPDNPEVSDKLLNSILADYSGGSVPAGTAVSALTGVVVTAHYSDGSTAAVTGYTLSGTIAEGENTITATYQGKTATFSVTGTTETGSSDAVNLYSGQYLKSANIDQHSENGNVLTYTPTQNGSSITYTIEGLEAEQEYTIFVDSTRADDGTSYTQVSVNTGSAVSYDGMLVILYPSYKSAGKNYATFTANGNTMYLWCIETGTKVAGTTPALTVYIYAGALTEKP